MSPYINILVLFISCVIQTCVCDICSTCLCSEAELGPIINCHEKQLGSNDMLNVDLLMLDEHQTLYELVLSKNNIVTLPGQLLKKLKRLRSLDLSENLINEIHLETFADLDNLLELNFSKNALRAFDDALFKIVPTLTSLNLSNNQISVIDHTIGETVGKLTVLDLSHNNISDLPSAFFTSLPELKYLDVSFNKIRVLGEESLMPLQSLTLLRISNNLIASLHLETLPNSLAELHAGYNSIAEISYASSQLEMLSIEYNDISQIQENITLLGQLQYLNVSGNTLSDFPNVVIEKLQVLDVSRNKLSAIPETLSAKNLPSLTELNVSKNPIRNLQFPSELTLGSFVASNIDQLEIIEEHAFSKLHTPPTKCMNITISANERLSSVHEKAFQNLNVCFLDLSNNHIVHISPQLIAPNANFETYGIDLQGNPFSCNCSLQWMLDDLVPKLYSTRPSLLDELRCASPPQISNMRMVHWYKWKGRVFCTDMSDFVERLTAQASSDASRTITFESSPGLLIALTSAITVFIILVIIGLLLMRRQRVRRSRFNRRF